MATEGPEITARARARNPKLNHESTKARKKNQHKLLSVSRFRDSKICAAREDLNRLQYGAEVGRGQYAVGSETIDDWRRTDDLSDLRLENLKFGMGISNLRSANLYVLCVLGG